MAEGKEWFKVTFRYDTKEQGRAVWNYQQKTFDVSTSDELDLKIKEHIRELSTRLVDRRYYVSYTNIEKL